MTQAELIDAYAEATSTSKAQAKENIMRFCDIITAELLGGGEVTLPHIGKLHIQPTAARMGRNPRTGEALTIPAGKKVMLSIGKSLKESLK